MNKEQVEKMLVDIVDQFRDILKNPKDYTEKDILNFKKYLKKEYLINNISKGVWK